MQGRKKPVLLVCNFDSETSMLLLRRIYSLLRAENRFELFSWAAIGKQEVQWEDVQIVERTDCKRLRTMEFVFLVGQNETLMETCACFDFMESPPILGIANGCAPILYNHSANHLDSIFELVLREMDTQNLPKQEQMKMSLHKNCQPMGEAVCQIEITRGLHPAILILNLYLRSICNKEKIKIGQFQGDGLLFFTPMGSYCKSMSLNCPLMERTMKSITITAICPLSMRFRTLTLPEKSQIYLQIDPHCRTDTAEIYVDDLDRQMQLHKGEELSIRMSHFHINMVSNMLASNEELFIKNLRNILRWGEANQHVAFEDLLKRGSFEAN